MLGARHADWETDEAFLTVNRSSSGLVEWIEKGSTLTAPALTAIPRFSKVLSSCTVLTLILRTVSLHPVFDLAYRDYILSWYTPLSHDEGQLHAMLSDDWRQVVGQLQSRLANIDVVNVVCYDIIRILHTHFTDLKAASVR